ncbi:MmcQ/YjbR family DNA-binding protein [Jatrophihabitans sp. DSM 45814]
MAPPAEIDRLREICLALPQTTERLSHGEPTWFVRDKKSFVMFADHHHNDGRLAFWCASVSERQQSLIEEDPETFFVPPYVGKKGWVGVRLDRQPQWDLIADLVDEAYRMSAPKSVLAELDRQDPLGL